jgi:hypothetical protein
LSVPVPASVRRPFKPLWKASKSCSAKLKAMLTDWPATKVKPVTPPMSKMLLLEGPMVVARMRSKFVLGVAELKVLTRTGVAHRQSGDVHAVGAEARLGWVGFIEVGGDCLSIFGLGDVAGVPRVGAIEDDVSGAVLHDERLDHLVVRVGRVGPAVVRRRWIHVQRVDVDAHRLPAAGIDLDDLETARADLEVTGVIEEGTAGGSSQAAAVAASEARPRDPATA